MSKSYNNSIVTLAFGATMVNFMIYSSGQPIYPRERIINIIFGAVIVSVLCLMFKNLDLNNIAVKYTLSAIISVKLMLTLFQIIKYYYVFYGSYTFSVIAFSVISIVMAVKMDQYNLSNTYIFYLFVNVVLWMSVFMFSADKLNVINIYNIDADFTLSCYGVYLFFDALPLSVLIPKGGRTASQNKYIVLSATAMVLLTLLQGLCIRGQLLYTLTPIQALFQIFSGKTVKRIDYLFTILQTINYFGAVTLYAFSVKHLVWRNKEVTY